MTLLELFLISEMPVGGLRWTVLSDSRWKTANLSVVSVSVENERKKSGGSHLCISSSFSLSFFSHFFLPVCYPSVFFLSPHHSCLSSPPSLSLSLSWCKVMKADVCRSGRARLRDYTASRMKDSWCSQGFVRLCMCVFGEGTGKREQGETEGKKEEAWGDKDIQCETNWWSAAGLTLRPAIILHMFSDATSFYI